MGVCDCSSIYQQNNLSNKFNKNIVYNLIPSKQPLKDKNNIKTPMNSSKSNTKDKNSNFYSITEINKNYKLPTKKSSPKNNINSNFSFEKSPILSKKSNSRNISFLKEEIQSKKKLNKKIPIYTKDSSTKKKIQENLSFAKSGNEKKNITEWTGKKAGLKYNENNYSSKKSISPNKRPKEQLCNNWSFNDLSYNNNINSISFNKSGIKSFNNRKGIMSQKNNKLNFNKNNVSQINKFNSKNINNMKKIKQSTESNLINSFNNVTQDQNLSISNYNSYNNKDIYFKKKIFLLNNNYSFYNKYSLYIVDDENINNKTKKYSNELDFMNILNQKTNNEMKLVKDLLKLDQRNWYRELVSLSKKITENKNEINKYFNQIIEKYILIHEHFNWIIYSLSIYFKNIFYENENNKIKETFFNNDNNTIFCLDNKIEKWFNGFKWKGIYIKVIPIEKSKILINEIKALNYYFFDYLQIIDKNQYIKKNININKVQLSDNIIFPLIGYTKINNLILYASALIIPEKTSKNLNTEKNVPNTHMKIGELIEQSNKILNYYSSVSDYYINSINSFETNVSNTEIKSNLLMINKNKKPKICLIPNNKNNNSNDFSNLDLRSSLGNIFYINDLLQSKLFKEINNYNLIRIKDGKYILFNISKYIPNLFDIKFKETKKYNFYSEHTKDKKFFTLNYNYITKRSMHNAKTKFIKTPENVLDKIYNIKKSFSHPLNYRDIYINNMYFRILYEETEKSKKDYKTKTFVDYLFTYNQKVNINEISLNINNNTNKNNNIKKKNIDIWNEEKNYIKGKYVILYDLLEPIKLDYSIIKEYKSKNDNQSPYNLFYLKTNYLAFFYSWCDILNKNNFNIKTYSDLKYFMKKYSINTNLLFFALIYIKNEDILDIIKIHLLIKVIYQIYINEDIYLKNLIKLNIILYIKNILYPHELTFGSERREFNIFYSKILFYANVLFFRYKLIDDYMGLGLLNVKLERKGPLGININNYNKKIGEIIQGFNSPKEFIKHIILIARKKPFLFLTELEQKLNVIINPYIKFKSSLSIESMKGEIKKKYIKINNIKTFSYINPIEISGLILAKLIKIYDPNDYKDTSIQTNNDTFNESIDETNMSENKNKLEIRHNFKNKTMPNDLSKKDKEKNNVNNNDNDNLNDIINEIMKENNNIFINEENTDENKIKNTKKNKVSGIQLISKNLNSKEKRLTLSKDDNNNKGEIHLLSWNDIYNKISIILPPICYKLLFNYEDKINNYISKNKYIFSNYLKFNYTFINSEILLDWKKCNLNIFQHIRTCTGNAESALLKTYLYLFIYYYFIKRNSEITKQINKEINVIFKTGYYKLSLNELALINLMQGLCCNKYVDSEEFFSKSLMLFLMNYGDPRGRNNDSHGVIQYPLWILSRKILKLKETIIYENFKEMYEALDYFESKKNFSFNDYNINNNTKKFNFNYVINVQNNIENILFLNNPNKNNNIINDMNQKTNNSFNNIINYNSKKLLFDLEKNKSFIFFNTPLTSIIDKDMCLNFAVFNNAFIEKEKNSFFYFPSISSKSPDINEEFYKENFIIYFFKQIQSLFMSRHLVYENEYINEIIFNEVFNPEVNIPENDFSSSNDLTSVDTKVIEDNSNNSIEQKNKNINSIKNYNIINSDSGKNSLKYNHINKKNNGNVFSNFLHEELLDKLSYKKNIPSGVIISFGNNTHNETSHDKYEMLTLPRIIFKLKNKIIDHIYSGWEHNIVLSNKGEIFSFGYNQSYQCALPNRNLLCRNTINEPTSITNFHNIYGKSISCGIEHSLILSNNNEVYGVGNNEDGVLGIEDIKLKSFKPILIHFGEKDEYTKKIKQISCGSVHNLALTDDGKVFSWGAAMGGQLGQDEKIFMKSNEGNKNYYLSKPTIISTFMTKKINITKVSCGEAHSIALSNNGNVYSWGFGSNGQLGLGFCEDSFEPGKGLAKSRKLLPEKINISDIKNIQCGKTFSLLINKENKLLACGNNDMNQLGFNHEKNFNKNKCHDIIYPTIIDSFSTFEIKKIACGEGHCLAIINDVSFTGVQNLWSWGNNKFGQLGQGSTIKISLPKPINLLMDYCNYKSGFEEISCGGFHSLCLVKYKGSINWIYEDFDKKITKIIDEINI